MRSADPKVFRLATFLQEDAQTRERHFAHIGDPLGPFWCQAAEVVGVLEVARIEVGFSELGR